MKKLLMLLQILLLTIIVHAQNVGIGTTTPAKNFEVSATSGTTIRVTSTNSSFNNQSNLELINFTGNNSWRIGGGSAAFYIAMSNDRFNSHQTLVDIFPATSAFEAFDDNVLSCGSADYRWTKVYAINGTIQTSDERLKKNIVPVDYGLSTLMKMRPVSYQWKDGSNDNRVSLGFLAQDMQKLVPECVYASTPLTDTVTKKDAKANLVDALGMNYSQLIPVLVKSIQEQQARIEKLETEIDRLKAGSRN